MINYSQYFIGREHTETQSSCANELIDMVNNLLNGYEIDTGNTVPINPHTGSQISGVTEGGFRLPGCTQGSPKSSHLEAKGVDIYDPDNKLDDWLDDDKLEAFGLYREHPDATPLWCHLTDRAPHSQRRTFFH